jgi:hypothetical protein
MTTSTPTQHDPADPAAWGDTTNGMFATWFRCDEPNVHGWFCDRRLDRMLDRAQAVKATQPRTAAAMSHA